MNPFQRVKALISAADEVKRHRVLSREEETKLLAACTDRRDYLRRLIICALDTGMCRSELFALTWRDVDFKAHRIRVRATTTKTLTDRIVPITARMEFELRGLMQDNPDVLVFGVEDCKKGFAAACKDAGIAGLRFHDLRATAITRMLQAGIPAQFVMRISGHTQPTTFQRYVRTGDQEIVYRVVEILNAQGGGKIF